MSRGMKDSEGELTSLDLLHILVGGQFAWALAYWASGNESNCPGQLDWTFFKPWTLVIILRKKTENMASPLCGCFCHLLKPSIVLLWEHVNHTQ